MEYRKISFVLSRWFGSLVISTMRANMKLISSGRWRLGSACRLRDEPRRAPPWRRAVLAHEASFSNLRSRTSL